MPASIGFRDAPAALREPASEFFERRHAERKVAQGLRSDAARVTILERQQQQFGSARIGSAFFGWLVATGSFAVLLAASAVISVSTGWSGRVPGTPTALWHRLVETPALSVDVIVSVAISFAAGGYVAGRMARFSGARQGFAVWLWSCVIIGAAVVATGLLAGAAKEQEIAADIRRVLVDVAPPPAVVVFATTLVLVSLGGAVAGGRAGMHFHRRVDRYDQRL